VRADGSVAQSATYDRQGRLSGQASIEGSSRDSTWARAQAWAMLGLVQAAQLANAPRDTSAAAIAAAALLKLAAPGGGPHRKRPVDHPALSPHPG
jgi:unsaturated chondroitin disaccharide hydrolase